MLKFGTMTGVVLVVVLLSQGFLASVFAVAGRGKVQQGASKGKREKPDQVVTPLTGHTGQRHAMASIPVDMEQWKSRGDEELQKQLGK